MSAGFMMKTFAGKMKCVFLCNAKYELKRVGLRQLKQRKMETLDQLQEKRRMVFKDKFLDDDSALLSARGIPRMSDSRLIAMLMGWSQDKMGDKGGKNLSMDRLADLNTSAE